jgi:hypothetical protein
MFEPGLKNWSSGTIGDARARLAEEKLWPSAAFIWLKRKIEPHRSYMNIRDEKPSGRGAVCIFVLIRKPKLYSLFLERHPEDAEFDRFGRQLLERKDFEAEFRPSTRRLDQIRAGIGHA